MKIKARVLFILIIFLMVFLSFQFQVEEDRLQLDKTNYIQPIIDNEGTKEAFIKTLKVSYKDLNTKVKSYQSDSTYYRCAYNTKVVFYSVDDSLVIKSENRKSCEINAFFNLVDRQYQWLMEQHIFYIKITNENTKYEVIHDLPMRENQRFLKTKLIKYKR